MISVDRTLLSVLAATAFTGACVADVATGPDATDDAAAAAPKPPKGKDGHAQTDGTGTGETFFSAGDPDPQNPFFASLGTNGRSCGTCHQEAQGMSVTPAALQARFDATGGTDPIFRLVDGANAPTADVSTVAARRLAYSNLLARGVIRVGLPIPATAEFTLAAVDDPARYASAAELSLFRRPLPSTNLAFLPAVMWDAREPSLGHQVIDATLGHAQATGVDQAQMDSIVAFETSLFTAQRSDNGAGDLTKKGGGGGAEAVANTDFFIGINDPLGHNPTGAAFDPRAFTLYDAWATDRKATPSQAAIARGQALFNTKPIAITGVPGLNDTLGQPTVMGTCTLCHDTPNVGNHSFPLALNLGLTDEANRAPGMPLYTLQNKTTGAQVKTTDPGRALITGKWADIGKFKGPVLRGLAMRAPYFHNGFAASLSDAVDFYDGKFGIGFTAQEKSDLVAFLQAL